MTCTRWTRALSQIRSSKEKGDNKQMKISLLPRGLFQFFTSAVFSCRAEKMANIEKAQRATGERQATGPRAEFWKLRGLRGNKKNEKNMRQSREDLLQLTIQGKFPAYERVLLREGWHLFFLIIPSHRYFVSCIKVQV